METFIYVLNLVATNCYMGKVDTKHADYSIPF